MQNLEAEEKLNGFPGKEYKKVFGEHAEIIEYKKKAVVLREGKVENYIYYNIKGCLALIINNNGVEICNGFSMEGTFFSSYTSFLTRKNSRYSILALEDTLVERMDYDSIQTAYELSGEAQKKGRIIAEQLYIIQNQRTISLITKTAEERYLELFKDRPELFQRIPLKYLASYLGVTPVSLSRLRNKIARL